jgi:hypothetical protein
MVCFKRKSIFILLILCFNTTVVFGQLNHGGLYTKQDHHADSSGVFVDVESLSFIHNREYFGNLAKGYTLFGNRFSPRIVYKPSRKISFSLGLIASKDFGNERFTILQPSYSFSYMADSTSFTFGNIAAQLSHRLLEPEYAFEGVVLKPIEQGLQYKIFKKAIQLDLWLDWQRMIYEKSTEQEKIWAGFSLKKRVSIGQKWRLNLPVHLTALHFGGQIGQNSAPVSTHWNASTGIELGYAAGNGQINFKNYVLSQYSDAPGSFKNAKALYMNLLYDWPLAYFGLSYWAGQHYQHPSGGDIYQNTGQKKNLIVFRAVKKWQLLPELFITARFEPVLDLQHAEGLFVHYNKNFRIKQQ